MVDDDIYYEMDQYDSSKQDGNKATCVKFLDDPRITRVGKFIRSTSIDELPQLFNVVLGEMLLVGPRPHPLELNKLFKSRIPKYMLRHKVKPGITGWAQVNGYRGITGSGMHTHLSLFKDGENAFYDPNAEYQLSQTALHFIAGLLEHAAGMVAVTNPLVNSYKRLTPGYEAPTNIAWSASNRSAMIRIPARRGVGTRAELRMPDPSCNPYLALAVMAAAGADGIERKLLPPPPIQRNIYQMTVRERRKHKIRELPGTLREALEALRKDPVIREALGEHVYTHFLQAKQMEWDDYRVTVHQWELDRYLATY